MTDAKDDHRIAVDTIPQHIGPDRRHLPPAAAHIASTLGEFGKSVRNCDQPLAQADGGDGIEYRNIGNDRFEMLDRFVGPDDLAQVTRR